MNWQILVTILVGLIIFIHGIENFSHEVLSFAGNRFRRILRLATRNRIIGGLMGMIVTAFIQSSTATTVITISLVSAGVISFAQSLGVIFGANVGTTITAQLVAFKITAYAPIFIILGFFLGMFGKSYKYIGRGIFYFGLVFFGLNLVSQAIEPIKTDPQLINFLSGLSNPLLALLVGMFITAFFHSSSITTGLVVIMAGGGVISLLQGIPILLGSNIGTTMTSITASSKLSLHAKRGAAAHAIFNIVGVLLLFPFIAPFTRFIQSLGGSDAQQIANAHTIFNVGAAILFLFILTPVKKLVTRIVPGTEEEILIGTKYLNSVLPDSNRSAFSLIEKELSYSLSTVFSFYELAITSIDDSKKLSSGAIDKYETLADLLDERIEGSLLELSKRPLSEKEAKKIILLVRISNMTEQLADNAKNFSRLPLSGTIEEPSLSVEALTSLKNIYSRIHEPFSVLKQDFPKSIRDYARLSRNLSTIDSAINRAYSQHIQRLKLRQAHGGSIFVEGTSLLSDSLERLKEILKLSQKYSRLR